MKVRNEKNHKRRLPNRQKLTPLLVDKVAPGDDRVRIGWAKQLNFAVDGKSQSAAIPRLSPRDRRRTAASISPAFQIEMLMSLSAFEDLGGPADGQRRLRRLVFVQFG